MTLNEKLLTTATELATQASTEILKLLKNPTLHHRKADDSIVTLADLKSDEIILKGLKQNFPEHAILSEETTLQGNIKSDWVWLVDPLDGTKAYAKQIPGFCVMIGLLKEGRPYLGVVVDPLEGHIYQALRGEGAFHLLHGKRKKLSVSSRKDFSKMPLARSPDFPKACLQKILEQLHSPLLEPINSVGIKVGLLVRQMGDIYLNHHPVNLWDTCAPQMILEEAGGKFTKWEGSHLEYVLKPPFCHDSATLASNGTKHAELIQLLSEIKLF